MHRFLIAATLVVLMGAVVNGDTLVLNDGRQYTGIVVKEGHKYTVFIGKRQFIVSQDDVKEWIKGDARPETSTVKPKPKPPVTAHQVKPADAKNIAALKRRGDDALAAGAHRIARNAFFDLLLIDPSNPDGLEGEGIAYMGMGDAAHARQLLESALTIAGGSSRSIALNTALANVRTKNPVRAGKIIRDLLVETKAEDTRALDLMLFALAECDDQARANRIFAQVEAYAKQYEADLQASHPGLRRWGSEWVSPQEFNQKEKERKSDQASIKPVEIELAQRKSDQADAEHDLAKLQIRQLNGVKGLENAINKQTKLVDQLRAAARDAEMKLDAVKNTATSAQASALALEPVLPGEPQTAVAMNTPAPAPPDPAPVVPTPAAPAPVTPTPATPAPAVTPAAPPAPAVIEPPTRRMVIDEAAGFAVGPDLIVTDAVAVEGATSISVQSPDGAPMSAQVIRKDDQSGLALLRVSGKFNYVIIDATFAGGAIKCVSFPRVSVFDPAAETIAGTLAPTGADWIARLDRHPRLGGGPLISAGGQVIGIELATRDALASQIRTATAKDLVRLLGADVPPKVGSARATDAIFQVTATH